MNRKQIPMIAGRKASLPLVYGDTPSFLGCPVVSQLNPEKGYDVIFAGVPWEGTVTWGSFSGCEFAPRTIRHASARYGGFLPEYEIDLFDYLRIGDAGDLSVVPGDEEQTMERVHQFTQRVLQSGSSPFLLGGDHSFTPEAVRALSDTHEGKIGIIHFDAHMDNSATFGKDVFPRCGPLYRAAKIENVDPVNIVHIGIRGPRNAPAQYQLALDLGSTIYTMKRVREIGIDNVISEALDIAWDNADHVYVTICSDVIDVAFNPGGPADFNGFTPGELFSSLYTIGERGISGLDIVEIYPQQDPNSVSSHLASWTIIYALAGIASGKKNTRAAPWNGITETS